MHEKLEIFVDYYSELYAFNVDQKDSSEFFRVYGLPPQLREEYRNILEGPITALEVSTAIDSLKANKSPGPDGLTAESYKNSGPVSSKTTASMFNR